MLALEPDPLPSSCSEVDWDAQFEAEFIGLVPFLRALAITLTRNRQLSEDLVQEALTSAWKARASYRSGSNLKAWLCTILRNVYSTHRRRSWRQVPWDADAAASIPAPYGAQRWASELTDVQRALAGVCIEQREALILVAIAGFSYEEVASMTGIAVGTVKSRVSRARAGITRILEQSESLPRRRRSSEGSALHEFAAQCIALMPAQPLQT
jgi:RNA polymerase sigma-70 factor, ECF subfamily